MDTNKDYEHPVLGPLTDEDVQHVIWNREAVAKWKAEDDALKAKINEIIELAREIGWCGEGDPGLLIQKLEKFRDEEL